MLNVLWTNRFAKKISKYNEMQFQVAAVVKKITVAERANPTTWHKHIKKLKDDSFGSHAVYREYLPDGARMVFILDGSDLILTDVGGHDVTSEYSHLSSTAINLDLSSKREPDNWFMSLVARKENGLKGKVTYKTLEATLETILQEDFGNDEAFRWWHESELNESWLQHLDKQQSQVADKVMSEILKQNEDFAVTFIVGGPGTGKTIVLLNLAINLEHLKREVVFELPAQVLTYLSSGIRKVPGTRKASSNREKRNRQVNLTTKLETLLIDDPISASELNQRLTLAKSEGYRSVIVALDPIQWHDGSRLNSFKKLSSVKTINIHKLNVCYRQSKGVGKESHSISRNIFNLSTRNRQEITSGLQEKEKKELLSSIGDVKFVDDGGRFKIYEGFTDESVEHEVRRFISREYRWSHTAPIAFIYEDVFLPSQRDFVKKIAQGQKRMDVPLHDYQRIRGVEFQELFIFLSAETWRGITKGKHGLSTKEWSALTSLYTVVSRPKDGLVVFVR
jgi:hypothetical protein